MLHKQVVSFEDNMDRCFFAGTSQRSFFTPENWMLKKVRDWMLNIGINRNIMALDASNEVKWYED